MDGNLEILCVLLTSLCIMQIIYMSFVSAIHAEIIH